MTPELQQLVRETMELTGSAPPALLDEQSPVLAAGALEAQAFYLVGMIGGKDVGKSALVNALVGQTITASTGFGPGTDSVIAYAHESQAAAVAELLQREVPAQHRIITHRLPHLARQVLLDLPDIDSHWLGHVEITRRMLRHLLFPLWVQSVEKYADRIPQDLLAKVAQGNDAGNFLFCLNKVDQLGADSAAVEELRTDFAARVGRTLGTPPPAVWMISAAQPGGYDLPKLSALLAQQKTAVLVKQSQQLAGRKQQQSLANWLEAQDLSGRAERLHRLRTEAEELLAERLGTPLLETALPALADDPSSRLALTDEVLAARCARWPVVVLVQTLMTPLLAIVRRNVGASRTATTLPDAEALVDAHLQVRGSPIAATIKSSFAQLQQMHPPISTLYRNRKLWEDMTADLAAAGLRTSLTEAIATQRQQVRDRLAGRGWAALVAPLRWLLTLGALLWFPLLQPACETWLVTGPGVFRSALSIEVMLVRIFSVTELLQNLTFLAMYFFVLWLILRWDTQRRVARLVRRLRSDTSEAGLPTQTLRWLDSLTAPIHDAETQARDLATRAEQLRPKAVAASAA